MVKSLLLHEIDVKVSSQIDEVEGAEEDDHDEEDHVPLTGGAQHGLVEVFPVVLSHEAEGGEEGPAEGVEARVAVVGVGAEALVARVVLGTDSRTGGVAAQEGVQLAGAVVEVPGGRGEGRGSSHHAFCATY